MRITAEDLLNKNASPVHLAMFRKFFGESAELTREVLNIAAAQDFDLDWFARNFLNETQQKNYERAMYPAWEKYDHVKDTEWAKYERAVSAKAAEYERNTSPKWEDYEHATVPALADILLANEEWGNYMNAEAQARAECRRASVEALADALGLD